jgi:hypothetical protein
MDLQIEPANGLDVALIGFAKCPAANGDVHLGIIADCGARGNSDDAEVAWHPGLDYSREGEAVKKCNFHRRDAETQRKALLFSNLSASASLR